MLKLNHRLVAVICIMTCFNLLIAFVSSRLSYISSRPLIYFEYIMIVFMCTWLRKKWLRISLFAVMVAVDCIHVIAQYYHHDDINFVLKLPQLFRSSYGAVFWAGSLCGILFLYVAISSFVHLIDASQDRKTDSSTENSWAYLVIVFLIAVYLLDGFNGTASWWPRSMAMASR